MSKWDRAAAKSFRKVSTKSLGIPIYEKLNFDRKQQDAEKALFALFSQPQPHLSRTHTPPFHPPLDYRNRRPEVHKPDIHPSLPPDQFYIRPFVQYLLCMV